MNKVFEKLASRWYSENSLSDVTWAFAEGYPAFKRSFINFFFYDFPETVDDELPTLIREHAVAGARVDFFFKHRAQDHLIEVKIWDQSHHFDQYKDAYKNSKKGYITNYNYPETDDYQMRRWIGFKEYLEAEINRSVDLEYKSIVEFYLSYLKSVCNLKDIPKVDLTKSSSLHPFSTLLVKIAQQGHKDFKIRLNWGAKSFDQSRYGIYLNVQPKDSAKEYWCWIGLYLQDSNPYIYMDLNISQLHLSEGYYKSLTEGIYHKLPEVDREFYPAVYYVLKGEKEEEFHRTETNSAEQERILGSFFSEVLENVKTIIEADQDGNPAI